MRPDSDIWLRQYFVDRLGALDRERAGWLATCPRWMSGIRG